MREFYGTLKEIPSYQNSKQKASDKEVFYDEGICNSQRIHGICGERIYLICEDDYFDYMEAI